MKKALSAAIPGRPRPQGSMTLWTGGDGKERAKYGQAMVQHRNLAVGVLSEAWGGLAPCEVAVALRVTFTFPRPRSHYGTGRNAEVLKPNAPLWMSGVPDLDKLVRLIGDALVIAGVMKDDSQIICVRGEKVYGESPSTFVEMFTQ
jgi:crossover junction endodeoxyribonuclease RusA